MLASNLSSLLILNERRKLGLMRLRGVPGKLLGQSLLISIGLGGLIGGIIGLTLGTLIPLYVYEGGVLSWTTLSRVQGPLLMLLFLIVGLVLVLLISRKLIRYATTISPLEASRRVAVSELTEARSGFAALEWLALLIGAYKIVGWIADYSLSSHLVAGEEDSAAWTQFVQAATMLDRALDFIALPLFVYGLVALLVAQRQLISGLLSTVTYFVGGKLRTLSLKHMSLKPHRISSFLLIVGLMASVSLYPSIASKSFEDKALRGATVQVGSELHVSISPTDLVSAEQFEQGLGGQVQAIRSALKERLASFQHPQVTSIEYLFEAILPGFFLSRIRTQRRPALSDRRSAALFEKHHLRRETGSHREVQRGDHGIKGSNHCGVATGGGVLEPERGRAGAVGRRSEQKTGVGTRERHRRFSSRHAAAQHFRSAELCLGAHRLLELSFQHRCLSRRNDGQPANGQS